MAKSASDSRFSEAPGAINADPYKDCSPSNVSLKTACAAAPVRQLSNALDKASTFNFCFLEEDTMSGSDNASSPVIAVLLAFVPTRANAEYRLCIMPPQKDDPPSASTSPMP
eukprot:scaffold98129_cov53-Attheya_sp.AAC.3